MVKKILFPVIILGVILILNENLRGKKLIKNVQIEKLRVSFKAGSKIPDPAFIRDAGEWYMLYHISSGLISYDQKMRGFKSLYAKSWESIDEFTHIFSLKDNVRFHDGTSIDIEDVIVSLKRLLVSKTSTHFPLWEYLVGCDSLTSISVTCDGLKAIDDKKIKFTFKKPVSSFYLQLASPETGIWSKNDIDPKTNKLTPTKFSGAYFINEIADNVTELRRNPYWEMESEFPDSPKIIMSYGLNKSELVDEFEKDHLDLYVNSYVPFNPKEIEIKQHNLHSTSPSTMVYFAAINKNGINKLGKDLINKIWSEDHQQKMIPATTFLPIGGDYVLNKDLFLDQLPSQSEKEISVATLKGYFKDGFLDYLSTCAKKIGLNLKFTDLDLEDYFIIYDGKSDRTEFDYFIAPYAASERYPAVQLRYMSPKNVEVPIDLKKTEVPSLGVKEESLLREYQLWLLKNQYVVPLFMYSTEIVYSEDLDVGEQPKTDAEIELWRVTIKP